MANPYEVWCHVCGCLMVKRKGKFGEFYGCTGYPKCFQTLNLRDAQLQSAEDEMDADPQNDDEIRYDRD